MEDTRWPRRGVAWVLASATFAIALYRLLPVESDAQNRLFCLTLAFAVALPVAVVCGRIGFGILIAGALAGCVWLAIALKLAYLHEPLLAPDLRYFAGTTTLNVIAHYPALWHKCVAALLGGALLAVLVWWLESPGWWRGRRVLMRGSVSLLALLPLLLVVWPQGPFRDIHKAKTWDFIAHAKRNPATAFLLSFARMQPDMPAYTPTAAVAYDWGNPPAATSSAAAQRPDIVAVLEESTLDPRQWAICTVPRCTFPIFAPDAATDAYGLLKVHTYGGATWVSEFAFLTGLPHTLFGPAGVYAPYNLAPRVRETLPHQLKALGYRTIAIYPMARDFFGASDAYADYGFDEFHDAGELGLRWESTDADLVQRFEDLYRRERARDDRPLFFMLLTMRQHGPHDKPLDALPPPWNAPLPGADARLNRNLGTYLFRLHQSSDALADLRRFLFADSRPAVLVHFGDHHPAFDGIESTLQSALPEELHAEAPDLTYYRIDSNSDPAKFGPYRTLDLAFLAGLVLDVAGLPKNAYFEANTRLRERCGGRFEDCPQHPLLDSYLAYTLGKLHAFAE
ncbi:MAG: sulfatase-like hydrolase/transferase [Lysobacterales bacterium]